MQKIFLVLLFSANFFFYSEAQTTQENTDCKCRYPFKPECSDYCIKLLLQKEKFKETMKKARFSDSTRVKLENWSRSTDNQPLESALNRREIVKLNSAIQTFSDDPANRDISNSRFMHSVGATISALFGKDDFSNSFSLMQTNFCYFPRYNFSQSENTSFSIGAPVGIGVGLVSNTFGGDAGVSFAYDLPVVVDYNFGCKATKNVQKNFGGYIGAGFGYYHVRISQSAFPIFQGAPMDLWFGLVYALVMSVGMIKRLPLAYFIRKAWKKQNCKHSGLMYWPIFSVLINVVFYNSVAHPNGSSLLAFALGLAFQSGCLVHCGPEF
jgi:hypothetical protein